MESAHPGLYSADLAPIPAEERTWQWRSLASILAGAVFCVPTYLLSRGMMEHGMSWWQAVLVVLAANLVLWLPMAMIGHAGTRYGIAYPVLLRASFGTMGARLPVLLRSALGIAWFAVQTWVASFAVYSLLNIILGGILEGPALPLLGVSFWQLFCFFGLWLAQFWVLRRWGMQGVHKLAWYGAPALLAAGLLLVLWAWVQADGFGSMLASRSSFGEGQPMHGQAMLVFLPYLAGMTALWMLLAINIPDYTRYMRDQRQQVLGLFVGLPVAITFFTLVGATIPFATVDIFNTEVLDPLEVVGRMGGFARFFGLLAIILAAMTTNLFAHLVPAATGIVSLSPQRLDLRRAATVAAVASLVLIPWRQLDWTGGTVFIWLMGLSALLSPIVGILVADYFVFRRRQLDVEALYQHPGAYSYLGGWSLTGLFALLVGDLLALPGFLMSVDLASADVVSPRLEMVYPYTPLLGLLVGGVVYLLLRLVQRLIWGRRPAAAGPPTAPSPEANTSSEEVAAPAIAGGAPLQ